MTYLSKFQISAPTFCQKGLVFALFVISSLILNVPQCAVAGSKCPTMGPRLTVDQYCAKYADEARRQMQKYGVPASITLAQGLLESGYGSSYLAVVANNHFGIKAYSRGWTGPTVLCDDDTRNEPFCKFSSVKEGYEYHSTFLRDNPRYAPLFKLDIRDYESWANGLKTCGYATNPKYGQLLIDLIERNHLDVYDVSSYRGIIPTHKLYVTSARRGLKYVRCTATDDLAIIAKEYGISERKLRSYNDLLRGSRLHEGDIIYLQRKRKRADRGYDYHTVRAGESLWSISQTYGVRVTSLMKRSRLVSATVHEGQVLRLR